MNSALDIALSGMRAAQAGLGVTSHNVANSSVEGYTRQRLVLTTRQARFAGRVMINGGVTVAGVERVADRFVTRHIQAQITQQSYYQTLQQQLGEIETVFNEADDQNLAAAFNGFFDGLSQLSTQPESYGVRLTTVQAAELLTSRLRSMRQQLGIIDRETRVSIGYEVDRVNGLLQRVAALNGQIAAGVHIGSNVSSLQDERQQVLEDLASSLGASVFVAPDESTANVSLGGVPLVLGAEATRLEVDSTGIHVVGSTTNLSVDGGALGALLEMRDGALPRYTNHLDTIAAALIANFNPVHAAGFGLNGSTGDDLFVGTDARDITVNAAVIADPNRLAASTTGAPGDSGNAKALLALRNAPAIGTQTIEEYYDGVVGGIGSEVQTADMQAKSLGTLLSQLRDRRDSTNSVSIDEEMTSLIRYQQAYAASARIISMIDEMMRIVANLGS